jgi:hypothetical protein
MLRISSSTEYCYNRKQPEDFQIREKKGQQKAGKLKAAKSGWNHCLH